MQRIIFVPQYPTPMRYQEWWITEFPKKFKEAGFDVITLGEGKHYNSTMASKEMFSPIQKAIEFETEQIKEYMDLKLEDDDILFLADLSFPGFFSNVFVHKYPKRMFAFCHATSINYKDYFAPVWMYKYPIEKTHGEMFNAVFLGSDYHDLKLNWGNTIVTRLPYPPFKGKSVERKDKYFDIISASRPTPQKVDLELENEIGEIFSPVNRPVVETWDDYFKNLAYSRILLITSYEDTFGYQIVDAVLNGCIPLAPNRCAYPELLPKEYLYNDKNELIRKIDYILNSDHGVPYLSDSPYVVPVPKLLCDQEMKDFYNNIIQIMKGEPEGDAI